MIIRFLSSLRRLYYFSLLWECRACSGGILILVSALRIRHVIAIMMLALPFHGCRDSDHVDFKSVQTAVSEKADMSNLQS